MEFGTFAKMLRGSVPDGLVLENPGGGTSTVRCCNNDRICYRRGQSSFYVGLRDLYDAYIHFAGGNVTTRQLKDYAPDVFDSERKGHNCHATFLFLILNCMGLAGPIWGRGRAGSPFGVSLTRNRE